MKRRGELNWAEKCMHQILHKILLIIIKYIPSIIAILYLCNSFLSYFGIVCTGISYLIYTSFVPWCALGISSYVFRFCIGHRLPLYYILICNFINGLEWSFGIKCSVTLTANVILFGIFIILGAYFKNRHNGKIKRTQKIVVTNS